MTGEDDSKDEFDVLDQILYLLNDENWHDLEEIVEEISISEEKIKEIMKLLEKTEMVETKNGEKKVKIDKLGITILELPSES